MKVPRRLVAPGLSVASGVLMFLAAEPVGAGPLALVATGPLFAAVWMSRRSRHAAGLGLLTATVYFGLHLYWIFQFGWMAWTGLVLALSLYPAGAAAVAAVFRRLPLAPVLAAASWSGFELLRDAWPFGGYPWGALGTSLAPVPGVRLLASAIGVYGLSFVCAFIGASLADYARTRAVPWGSIALVAGSVVLFAGVDAWRYGQVPDGPSLRVATIQPSVPRPVVIGQDRRVFEDSLELTLQLESSIAAGLSESPDVIVWPESAIGFAPGPDALDEAAAVAARLGTPMLVGLTDPRPATGEFFNTMVHIDDRGRLGGTYAKQHPVPFGEYVPIKALRRFVSTLEQVPLDMARGREPVVFDVAGAGIATPICFESVFPRDVRRFARLGSELIVLSTNDSSFERTAAAAQHLAHARLRAIEQRQYVVQAALSGISAVVSPSGEVSRPTRLFEQAVLEADVPLRPARSLYWRFGDLFSYVFVGGAIVALAVWTTSRRWPRAPGPAATEDVPGAPARPVA